MHKNNSNDHIQDNEIDLMEISKILFNSKKLIIVTTLIITLLGTTYSFIQASEYKSNALIEIGNYGVGEESLESAKMLIKELNIQFIHKQKLGDFKLETLRYEPIEKRLLNIEYISAFPDKGKEFINELVIFTKNRHSNLQNIHTQKIENKLTNKIEMLIDKIEFSKNELLNHNTNNKLIISNKIEILNNSLPSIESKIKALNKVIMEDEADNLKILALIDYENLKSKLVQEKNQLENELKSLKGKNFENEYIESNFIFTLSQEKNALELELELLMKDKPLKTKLVGEIMTVNFKPNRLFLIFLSLIFGLFLSIIMVLINNFLKAFKEELV
jgi:uncharacterized protein involved in exopolysaccharide biosynthesis